MNVRAPWCVGLVVMFLVATAGCNDRVAIGSNCFDTQECRSGGVCTETVYGNFCLQTCSEDTVRCDDAQACLEGAPFIDGTGGAGGSGGAGGGAGGDGGAGGAGGDSGTGLFVCLPGTLNAPDFEPVLIGQVCTYSLDCELGGACVCLDGQDCDLDNSDRDGPICVEVCDFTMVNRCPFQQACVDLGNGRGFCDPSTSQPD
ncbi:MAG: hypothetical protein AAF436_08960 [Myxococcota bacterium]